MANSADQMHRHHLPTEGQVAAAAADQQARRTLGISGSPARTGERRIMAVQMNDEHQDPFAMSHLRGQR